RSSRRQVKENWSQTRTLSTLGQLPAKTETERPPLEMLLSVCVSSWFSKALVWERLYHPGHVTDCREVDGAWRPDGVARDLPTCGEAVAKLTRSKRAVVQ